MLFDDTGRAADYRFLEINPAFEKHTGMTGAAGRTMRELVPDLESHWFETYGRVAQTGESVRFVDEARAMEGRWFDLYAFRLGGAGSDKVAILFNDITTRKLAEETLQASDARHTFLVTLADTLRPLSDPIDVQAEASRLLGEQLEANRVAYFEVHGRDYVIQRDYAPAAPSIVGRQPISSFGADLLATLLAGRVVVEPDVDAVEARSTAERAAFAAIQIRAHVGVPLVKGGYWWPG